MRFSNDIYEFIKGEAIAVLERFGIRCFPISGFEIAMKMGIALIPYSSLSEEKYDAAIRASPDGFYVEDWSGKEMIFFNDLLGNYERINWTILHEIGHCVLDHTGHSEEEESEANFFAKYIAAPPPLVHLINPICPDDIATTFCLSYQTSAYSYIYYRKWLRCRDRSNKDYEQRLLKQFRSA